MIILVLIVAGLLAGSFVNAFVWRLHKRKDWVGGRSECTHCHHPLAPKDLVPVFSWLSLGGRCRYCKRPIEDSPLVELVVPILFVVSYLAWPASLIGAEWFNFVAWLFCLVAFTALAVYDLRHMLLPDKVVFPLIGFTAVVVLVDWLLLPGGTWQQVASAAAGAAVISGLFFLLYSLSKGTWIGFGDVKLGVALGLLAGSVSQAVLLLFLASLIGMLVAVPLMIVGRASRKTLLPFGPLLLAACVVVQLWGAVIVDWYLTIFAL